MAPNGNTVTYEYYLDGLLKHQLETKANGTTVVAEHTIGYDPNGNRVTDVARTMDADQHNKPRIAPTPTPTPMIRGTGSRRCEDRHPLGRGAVYRGLPARPSVQRH